MTALEILTRWIDYSRYQEYLRTHEDEESRKKWKGVDTRDNLKAFWLIRDVVEYPHRATPDSVDWALEFLGKGKPSPEVDVVKAAVLAAKERKS